MVLGLAAGVALLCFESELARPRSEPSARDSVSVPEATAPGAEALTRSEQFLRARGGDRRIARDLCGPEVRARMEREIEGLGENELIVDPASWERRTISTRVGMVSWMSKCVFDGGGLLIRSTTGNPLATYDPASGFRPAE